MNRLLSFPAAFLLANVASAQNIRVFTLQGTGAKTAHIEALVPSPDCIVEDSPDLILWNRVSNVLRPGGQFSWTHTQAAPWPAAIPPLHITPTGNFVTRRFYRVRGLPPGSSGSSGSTSPQGRLTQPTATKFQVITKSGWTIAAEGTDCTISAPGNPGILLIWGPNGHENLQGKQIKDCATDRRTILLPGDTMVTFFLAKKLPSDAGPTIQTVSIYDDDQSHRINLHTVSIESSSTLTRAGEATEPDGETARIWDTGAGFYLENIYTESTSSNGQPLPQQAVPLGRTYGPAQPNRVDDFFDDPRLGHT